MHGTRIEREVDIFATYLANNRIADDGQSPKTR
jgi:hypothetical protein